MRLTVVGCAGSFPNAASPASCYLVEHDGHRIVLDLGNGSLGALQQHVDLVWPGALDAVVLSHCHIDHCADLGSLYVQRHYSPAPAAEPLLVLGPTEARARAVAMYGKADEAGLDHQFDFVTFPREAMTVGPFTIETARAAHPVEAYSIRVSAGGRSLTYSGDTGPTPRLTELARGTDIAVFEASFVGETLARLGLRNVVPAALGPFPRLNPEFVVRAAPDWIVATERAIAAMPARPGWGALAALRTGRTCGFAPDRYDMLVRPGPRMGEAAELLADCLAAGGGGPRR